MQRGPAGAEPRFSRGESPTVVGRRGRGSLGVLAEGGVPGDGEALDEADELVPEDADDRGDHDGGPGDGHVEAVDGVLHLTPETVSMPPKNSAMITPIRLRLTFSLSAVKTSGMETGSRSDRQKRRRLAA